MEQHLDRESMGAEVQHPFDPFGVLRVPLHDPKPLSAALKRKWDGHRGGHTEKLTSHDDIEAKLTLAEQKRQDFLQWVMRKAQPRSQHAHPSLHKQGPQERSQRLEQRLAAAEANRQSNLAAVQLKARASTKRGSQTQDGCLQAAERLAVQQSEAAQAAARITARLQAAEAARQARLAAAVLAAGPGQPGDKTYLQRRAVLRVWLRRQGSSRKLQRMWRGFVKRRQTTHALAVKVAETGITGVKLPRALAPVQEEVATPATPPAMAPNTPFKSEQPAARDEPATAQGAAIAVMGVKTGILNGAAEGLEAAEPEADSFEAFAKAIQSVATLKATQALLARLEVKLRLQQQNVANIGPLLQRLFPKTARSGAHLERYPTRIFLCAYMVQSHPQTVFNHQGELEDALTTAGSNLLGSFEALLTRLAGPVNAPRSGTTSPQPIAPEGTQPTAQLLVAFDAAWARYLERFVAWKFADAASLEAELIKVAIEMEVSMLGKTGGDGGPLRERSEDLQAVVEQVQRDHALLRARILRLGGRRAIARLEAGLVAARAAAEADQQADSVPGSSSNGSPTREPAAAPAAEGPASSSALGNDRMAWELLYDLRWRLPTEELDLAWSDALGTTSVMQEGDQPDASMSPDQVAAHVQTRVRRIAEQAFWDSVAASLAEPQSTQGGQAALAGQLASLLAGMGQELLAVLPEQARGAREQLAAQLDEGRLRDVLQAHQGAAGLNGIDTAHLLSVLQQTAMALRDMGAAAREAAAREAHANINSQLSQALASGAKVEVAAAVARALRVLTVQLKMLRMDAANFRLTVLADALKDGSGIRYAGEKLLTAHSLTSASSADKVAAALPQARAWIALVAGQVPQAEPQLAAVAQFAQDPARVRAAAAAQSSGVPVNMRAGLRATPGGSLATPAAADTPKPAADLVHPVLPGSWRGIVRQGLAAVAGQEAPAQVGSVAETLALDVPRLHRAQNDFQRLVVLAACLLLAAQARSDAAAQGPTAGATAPADMKRRLSAMLADPNMRLPDLAAELVQLGGLPAGKAQQKAMEASLNRMLVRSGGAFKALSTGMTAALQIALLAGPPACQSDTGLQQALHQILARCGGAALKAELLELAERLAATAALTEAVHGGVYQQLLTGLI